MESPGWPKLRGDTGKIFVKLGESLVIDNVCYYDICRLWESGRIVWIWIVVEANLSKERRYVKLHSLGITSLKPSYIIKFEKFLMSPTQA